MNIEIAMSVSGFLFLFILVTFLTSGVLGSSIGFDVEPDDDELFSVTTWYGIHRRDPSNYWSKFLSLLARDEDTARYEGLGIQMQPRNFRR